MAQRRILVTAALPYANGHIHLGHLVEYLQTDIWVRFQKLRGHRCLYICADDTHGTAIMIRARQEGRSEEALIADMREAHIRDFAGFEIEFDNYGSTHSEANRELCAELWKAVTEAGLVVQKDVEQFYDPEAQTFLADRFIRGECPVCHEADQYGDHCDHCLSTYSPTDLTNPKSTLSGATPELRSAPHKFIRLEQIHDFLEEWTQSGEHLQSEVANYLKGHFLGPAGDSDGPRKQLKDWDVTRPPQYFGFEVPDFPGNYWYVWFDAPIGYMASTVEWCRRHGERLEDWWPRDPFDRSTELHHFIGKDITYFHTLFWPGVLKTAGFKLPTKVHIHGFLTVGGEKMSKSKGTFVMASTYLKHLDPAYLRYYYASKLGPRLDDLDLNLDEFAARVNSDLVGKVVNLASRSAKFVEGQTLSPSYPEDGGLFEQGAAAGERIAALYENCDYNAAMREIMVLADNANRYVEDRKPWDLRKDPARQDELRDVCTVVLNLFRQIAVYLAPVLPRLARQAGELLGRPIERWDESQRPLTGTPVASFTHMLKRVELKQVDAMIDESKAPETPAGGGASSPAPAWNDSREPLDKEPLTAEHCTFDEFMKVDMRVARVIAAGHVEGADKLLRLTLSLGGEERRHVFAGIKGVYQPEDLVGRLVICCANLAPRKMRFGTSEGMVLAAGAGGKDIYVLSPDGGAQPGMRVH
ncbi:MAG TPA: methionine--tRNA ligase [Planctomycetaceae bacterium]|nr:methionine--tRNA ligase [Planctomycetaceae bacterium]